MSFYIQENCDKYATRATYDPTSADPVSRLLPRDTRLHSLDFRVYVFRTKETNGAQLNGCRLV